MAALDGLLEAQALATCSDEFAPLVSIAISLKRIADAVAPTEGLGLADHIQAAIGTGIGQGADYALGLWIHR